MILGARSVGESGWGAVVRLVALGLLVAVLLAPLAGRGASAQSRSVVWQDYDVTLDVQQDGTINVTERQVVDFRGGPFRTAFANIPTSRIDAIGNVGVAEEVNGLLEPYQAATASNYAERPETFRARETSSEIQIDWAFPSTTGQTRTFVLTYTVAGAIRSYPDNVPANQQLWWNAIASDVTEVAPVENASATIILPQPVPIDQALVDQYSDDSNVPANPGQAQDVADNSRYTTDGQTWTYTASDLEDGEGLFVRLQFPPIVDAPVPSWQQADDAQRRSDAEAADRAGTLNLIFLAAAVLLAIGGGIAVFALWYTRGRDPHVGLVADIAPAIFPVDLSSLESTEESSVRVVHASPDAPPRYKQRTSEQMTSSAWTT